MKQMPSLLAASAVAAAVACSDSFKPTTENVLGDYTLQTFQSTDATGTTNWVQRGGTLTISLGPFGVTTGHLFMPGADEGGGDLDQLLIGDWTLSGNTITFDMPAVDTFIRDMPWTVTENTLSGDHTFSGTRIRVVLTK
ncbi:MAG TPA: hypothetical protein VGQ29_02800 [Gemmatimonadales bacterium]|jgi:hypothetical protein|nr:hypothetical protein [Gemmatimonadales bacterium]